MKVTKDTTTQKQKIWV